MSTTDVSTNDIVGAPVATTVEDVLSRFSGGNREDLIPILQAVQNSTGHLSRESVLAVARHLNLPPSKVYGVATLQSIPLPTACASTTYSLPRNACHVRLCCSFGIPETDF